MSSRTFLRTFVAVFAPLALITMGFNALMDPFGMYRTPLIEGVNRIKPQLDYHPWMSRAWGIYHSKPTHIILGSSRVLGGIDPAWSGWGEDSVYNAGISGGNIYELNAYFAHAAGCGELEMAVVGLDFFMFNGYRPRRAQCDEGRLVSVEAGIENPSFSRWEIPLSLTSKDTVKHSLKTLFGQNAEGQLKMEPGTPTIRRQRVEGVGGHRNLFKLLEAGYAKDNWKVPDGKNFFEDPDFGGETFQHFRSMVAGAYREKIDLKVFLSPAHARFGLCLKEMQLWDEYETWKRRVVRIVEEEARKVGRDPLAVWDFDTCNAYTTEDLPPLEKPMQPMKWYWEDSHYTYALGHILLNRLFGLDQNGAHGDFGVPLHSTMMDDHLRDVQLAQQKYGERNPDDVREIQEIVGTR